MYTKIELFCRVRRTLPGRHLFYQIGSSWSSVARDERICGSELSNDVREMDIGRRKTAAGREEKGVGVRVGEGVEAGEDGDGE